MAKIKLTKTELKSQQDALKQYNRFLPTLQLKKQQLQMEIRASVELLRANEQQQKELTSRIGGWIALFGGGAAEKAAGMVVLREVRTSTSNIAGVTVPVFEKALFEEPVFDAFALDWFYDDAMTALRDAVALREAFKVLEEQHRLLSNELRTTTQRVNLFEKVKIPECRDNIRKIGIQLGDLSTAAVARSKIAKRKTQQAVAS